MQVTCPNPGCGAAYTVGPQHVGHRSVCKKCGATFLVEADGLRLVEAADAGGGSQEAGAHVVPASYARSDNGGGIVSLITDPFSWLLLIGSFIVILFLFLPIIDQFKVTRLSAQIDAENARQQEPGASSRDRDATAKRIKEMQEQLRDLRFSIQGSRYWYAWGMMVGFLCLAVAEIGYLASRASKARRVVGAVLLSAQLLLVFLSYMIASMVTAFTRL